MGFDLAKILEDLDNWVEPEKDNLPTPSLKDNKKQEITEEEDYPINKCNCYRDKQMEDYEWNIFRSKYID